MIYSLAGIQTAIEADLGAEFSDRVRTIEWFDPLPDADDQERLAVLTPAILLNLEQIDHEEADSDGTDRIPTRLFLTADCFLPASIDNPAAQVREFGAAVAAHIWRNTWGLRPTMGDPEALSSQPAELKPGTGGYVVWRVMWEQLAMLGANVWDGAGITPTQVWLGLAPLVGDMDGTAADYILIHGEPDQVPTGYEPVYVANGAGGYDLLQVPDGDGWQTVYTRVQ
jgi:hypothetical protein